VTFVLSIEMDNAAFEDDLAGREVSRILRDLCERIDAYDAEELAAGAFDRNLYDVNGNHVGRCEVKER